MQYYDYYTILAKIYIYDPLSLQVPFLNLVDIQNYTECILVAQPFLRCLYLTTKMSVMYGTVVSIRRLESCKPPPESFSQIFDLQCLTKYLLSFKIKLNHFFGRINRILNNGFSRFSFRCTNISQMANSSWVTLFQPHKYSNRNIIYSNIQ